MIVVSSSLSRIYLLRHAESGWPENGQKDFDRTLSDAGYAQAEVVMDQAADRNYRPDLVLCSTAVRCRQTAEAVRRTLCAEDIPLRYIDQLYNGSLEIYLEILSATDTASSVMLIGHNPTISETLETLVGADQVAAVIAQGYPPCGLAVLDRNMDGATNKLEWRVIDFLQA
ncbi:phosphohistidine phosphatase [Agrobacterium vitis]|nr:phosphohistidine phosphatase [Agrobacterium vitis]